jgi:hypothetical protein
MCYYKIRSCTEMSKGPEPKITPEYPLKKYK